MRVAPRLIALAALLAIGPGCTPQTPAHGAHDAIADAQCRDSGGEYRQVGMLGTWSCVHAFADGGRQCTDGSECLSGACIADLDGDPAPKPTEPAVGSCQRTTAQFGCFAKVAGGKRDAGVCVD